MFNRSFIIRMCALLALLSVTLVFADPLEEIAGQTKKAYDVVQQEAGKGLKNMMGFAPIILFFLGAANKWRQENKKSKMRDEDSGMLPVWIGVHAILGFIIGHVIINIISLGVLNSPMCGSQIFFAYWQKAMGMDVTDAGSCL